MPVHYSEIAPTASLARQVECLWTLAGCRHGGKQPVPPDGCMDLIYERGRVRLIGAMTAHATFPVTSSTRLTGLRFHPGWLPALLRLDASVFTDDAIGLCELDGKFARGLERAFERGPAQVSALVESRLGAIQASQPSLRAIEWARLRHGLTKVDWLADQCGLSERQFRRQVLARTGLAPKFLLRVWRFRRALALAGQLPWANLAAECGYSDQSHLIHDWREFTGQTPQMSDFSNPIRPGSN